MGETVKSMQSPADDSLAQRECGEYVRGASPLSRCHGECNDTNDTQWVRRNGVLLPSHGPVCLNAVAHGAGCGGADPEPPGQTCLCEMEPVFYQSPLEGTGPGVSVCVHVSVCVPCQSSHINLHE